jgi:hypothetical protein
MRITSNELNGACAKYHSPTEHLVVDKINVLFKGRSTFQTVYTKEIHRAWDKVLQAWRFYGTYTQDMTVYLGEDRECVTATCITVTKLSKLFMDNFLSPDLYGN